MLMAIKAGEADMGLAVGVEKMGKAGLLGRARHHHAAARGADQHDERQRGRDRQNDLCGHGQYHLDPGR